VASTANYWTNFRGPNRDGRYEEAPILTNWPSTGLQRLWKQPCGGGYASFVIADGKAFTIEQRRNKETVAAYDAATGKQVWINDWEALFSESLGGDGPRATPTYDEGKIYALGAAGELRCLLAETGRQVWRVNILEDNGATNLTWGMAAAPLIVDGKVIVLPGGSGGKSVVAYDKLTGKPVWKALDDRQSYTAPMVVTLGGKRQLIVVSARRVMGLTVEDGTLLWDYPWTTEYDINASQPLMLGDNRFFISAAYDHGAAVVELTPSGTGLTAKTVWQNNRMKNKFTSSVLYDGYIYGLDESILACIDPRSGDLKWKGGRYGYGQVVLASGHLIVLTESGEVVLVKATPERHQEVAKFPAIDGKTWNHPALAGGRLFVRNEAEMAAFRIAAQ
jgi:outer membrane protein assembly factor BamB